MEQKNGKNIGKRLTSLLLALVLCMGMVPGAAASGPQATSDSYDAEYNLATDTVTIEDGKTYRLYGTGTTPVVVPTDVTATLVMDNAGITAAVSPLQLEGSASVTLALLDGTTNSLICTATAATPKTAGISVPAGASLTVTAPVGGAGDGALTVQGGYGGAGIGGNPAQGFHPTAKGSDGNPGAAGGGSGAARSPNGAYAAGVSGGTGGAGGAGGQSGADSETAGSVRVEAGVLITSGGIGGAGIGGGMGATGGDGLGGENGANGPAGNFVFHAPLNHAFSGGGGGGGGGSGGNGGGGGTGGTGGNVTIMGGTVSATGGTQAAGIGGGAGGIGGEGGPGGTTGGTGGSGHYYKSTAGTNIWARSGKGGQGGTGAGGNGGGKGTGGAGGSLAILGGTITAKGHLGAGQGGNGPARGADNTAASTGRTNGEIHSYGGWNSSPASSGGNGGAGGARVAVTDGTDGASAAIEIQSANANIRFEDTTGAISASRPVDQNGTSLYYFNLTVKGMDGAALAPDTAVTIPVKTDADPAKHYTYHTVTRADGTADLWLPLGSHIATGDDLKHTTLGNIPDALPLTLTVVDNDNNAGTALIAPGDMAVTAAPLDTKVYDGTVKLTAAATNPAGGGDKLLGVRWLREALNGNTTEYTPYADGTYAYLNTGSDSADYLRNLNGPSKNFGAAFTAAPADDKGSTYPGENTVDENLPAGEPTNSGGSSAWNWDVSSNGRYWVQMDYETEDGYKYSMIQAVLVSNLYTPYPIQVRGKTVESGITTWLYGTAASYEVLKNADGSPSAAVYGIPFDLGYDPTAAIGTQAVVAAPKLSHDKVQVPALDDFKQHFKAETKDKTILNDPASTTITYPGYHELTLDQAFLSARGVFDNQPNRYTLTYIRAANMWLTKPVQFISTKGDKTITVNGAGSGSIVYPLDGGTQTTVSNFYKYGGRFTPAMDSRNFPTGYLVVNNNADAANELAGAVVVADWSKVDPKIDTQSQTLWIVYDSSVKTVTERHIYTMLDGQEIEFAPTNTAVRDNETYVKTAKTIPGYVPVGYTVEGTENNAKDEDAAYDDTALGATESQNGKVSTAPLTHAELSYDTVVTFHYEPDAHIDTGIPASKAVTVTAQWLGEKADGSTVTLDTEANYVRSGKVFSLDNTGAKQDGGVLAGDTGHKLTKDGADWLFANAKVDNTPARNDKTYSQNTTQVFYYSADADTNGVPDANQYVQEEYKLSGGGEIQAATKTGGVLAGASYSKIASDVAGYAVKGWSLDGGTTLTVGKTATHTVTADEARQTPVKTVTFVYTAEATLNVVWEGKSAMGSNVVLASAAIKGFVGQDVTAQVTAYQKTFAGWTAGATTLDGVNVDLTTATVTLAATTQTLKFHFTEDAGFTTITVKGVDGAGAELYSYDQKLSNLLTAATVQSFTVPKYKLASAAIGGVTAIVTNGGVKVNPSLGDQTVTFHYASNLADVTIKAQYKDTTSPVAGFTEFKVQGEADRDFTYTAPAITGHTNTGHNMGTGNKITVAPDGSSAIIFYYTKNDGNITYRAEQAGGALISEHSANVTLSVGEAPVVTPDKAPVIPNWKLANDAADGTPSHALYNGVHDVTVTFVYEAKTKDVTVKRVNQDTGLELGTVTTPYATGSEHTIAAPAESGYAVVGETSKKVYVIDNTDAVELTFYYRATDKAEVTVELYYNDGTNDHVIQSYTVPGMFGVEQTIAAPAVQGFTKPADVKFTPTIGGANQVRLLYVMLTDTVTVDLKDDKGTPITAPAGFATSYQVKQGDGVTVTAPSILGYTLAAGETLVKGLTAAEIAQGTRTIAFAYEKSATALYVRHTVVGMAGAIELFRYVATVEKGAGGAVTYTAPTLPGYQPDTASKDLADNADGAVTFAYTEDAATIKVIPVDNVSGNALPNVAATVLTGYRAGQEVAVVAPAVTGKVLVGALTKSTTVLAGENEVEFPYVDKDNVTFELTDKTTGKVIRVVNGVLSATYDPAQAGNALNLSGDHYTYTQDGSDTNFVAAGDKLTVTDVSTTKNYVIMYTKSTRDVTILAVEKGNEANVIHAETHSNVGRVGETYVAAATQQSGWTLADNLRKAVEVKNETGALEIKFLYEKKQSGTVTVTFKSGTTQLAQFTASAAVGEEFTATAPDTLESGKYTRQGNATKTVTVGTGNNNITFQYDKNFVTVNVYTLVAGGANTFVASHDVAKNGSLSLNPLSLGGYVLKKITVGGVEQTLTDKLDLTALNTDTEVVFGYEKIEDVLPEYQVALTVMDIYGRYTLEDRSAVYTKGAPAVTLHEETHAGYTLKSYTLDGANHPVADSAVFSGVVVDLDTDHTLSFVFERTDGSALVPGRDDTLGTDDDVNVTPGTGGQAPTVAPDGTVTVPDGGTVITPDGTVMPPQGSTVKPDGSIILPDGGTEFDPKDPDAPLTGYYQVIYAANGGTGTMARQVVADGAKVAALPNGFTRGNYNFQAWNTRENGSGTAYAVGAELSAGMTLYAQWNTQSYQYQATVTFYKDGAKTEQEVQIVGSYTDPTLHQALEVNSFVLADWTFTGWNTAADGSGTAYADKAGVTLSNGQNLELYAQWVKTAADGTVTLPGGDSTPGTDDDVVIGGNGTDRPELNPDGTVTVPPGGSVITPGGTVTLPDGGAVDPDGSITDNDGNTVTPGQDVLGYYRVIYKAGSGGTAPDYEVLVKDAATTTVAANMFTYAGHIFAGWKDAVGNTRKEGDSLATATILTAQWLKQDADGSITVPGDNGDVVVKPNPEEPDIKPDVDGDGNVTVPPGGSVTTPDGEVIPPDGSVVKPDGSIEAPDGMIDPEDPGATDYVQVTYNANGGVGTMAKQLVKNGSLAVILDSGYVYGNKVFDAWNTSADGSGTTYLPGEDMTASENVILYAQWRSDGTIVYNATITFHSSDGSGDAVIQTVGSADSSAMAANLRANSFAISDWTFGGWRDATGNFYKDSAIVVVNDGEALDMYAQWQKQDGNTVILPGEDQLPESGDDVVIGGDGTTPPTYDGDTGHVTVPPNGTVELPESGGTVTLPDGGTVAPDGTITIPDGGTAILPGGDTITGPGVINPDGTTSAPGNDKPRPNPDESITLPGPDHTLNTGDDVVVRPGKDDSGSDNSSVGTVDGVVTLPDGGTVTYPTTPNTVITVPGGTQVNPDGSLMIPDGTVGKVEPDGPELPGGSEVMPDGTIYWTVTVLLKSGTTVLTAPAGFQDSYQVKHGESMTVYAPAITGYVISGGNSQTVVADGAKTITFEYAKPTSGGGGGGVTYYALTFESNGGTAISAVTKPGGTKISLNQKPTRAGYVFSGWYADKALAEQVETLTLKGNLTVYAGWTQEDVPADGLLNKDFTDGYVLGNDLGLFLPDAQMTRAEAAAIFFRLLADQSQEGAVSFSDVEEGRWYTQAVHTLASKGILKGYGGAFRPDDTMTRAEFTALVARFAQVVDDEGVTFPDVAQSHWAAAEISAAAKAGLIKGMPDGTFQPERSISRAEAVKMVNALLGRGPQADAEPQFLDMAQSHWAYGDIMAAAKGQSVE